jgi:hypothetical protein
MSSPTPARLRRSWYKCTRQWDEVRCDLHEVQFLGRLEQLNHLRTERASLQFRRCSMTITMRIGNTKAVCTLTVGGCAAKPYIKKAVAQERHGMIV